MQSFTLPYVTWTNEDELPQCWKEVEAETGFSSYASFLEALPETGPQFNSLLWSIDRSRSWNRTEEVVFLDILKDSSTSIRLQMRSVEDFANASNLCTELLQNIQSPPDNTHARIILCSTPEKYSRNLGMIDAFGLGLKVQPSSFEKENITVESDCIRIGNCGATVARNYGSKGDIPPVLLILKRHKPKSQREIGPDCNLPDSQRDLFDFMVRRALTLELHGSIVPCRSTSEMRSPNDQAPLSIDPYSNYLLKTIQKNAGNNSQSDASLLAAMLPLVHLEVLRLRARSELLYSALLRAQTHLPALRFAELEQKNNQILEEQRFLLRRQIESLEESRARLVQFTRSQSAAKWLEDRPWRIQDEEIREAMNEARAKEAEARDYMQLQIGNLSISESRRCIELFSLQMSETKRVKIFTILAFIYVPINLAASIFGGNLQQLNQSGQTV